MVCSWSLAVRLPLNIQVLSIMKSLLTTAACNLFQGLSSLMLWLHLTFTAIWLPTQLQVLLEEQVSCQEGNVGQDHAIFEQGASAGNVGNDNLVEQQKANPVALLLSSAMMLRHLQFPSFADRLETAVKRVIADGKYRTKDLGGTSTTQEVTDAVIANLD
uniref:Isopropylmalate dehydrogenase-like domain-containing protein n=1 Tax=Aegilops tauschii subsp. strangulata TaxID=200361 RepID=A0A453C7M5_AEGTS